MTLEQFLKKLRTTPRDWTIDDDTGALRHGSIFVSQCPMAAVEAPDARSRLSRTHADVLHLAPSVTKSIMIAADSWPRTLPEKRLRRRLLRACGVREIKKSERGTS